MDIAQKSLTESLKYADSELLLEMKSQLNEVINMFKEKHHRINHLQCVSYLLVSQIIVSNSNF